MEHDTFVEHDGSAIAGVMVATPIGCLMWALVIALGVLLNALTA